MRVREGRNLPGYSRGVQSERAFDAVRASSGISHGDDDCTLAKTLPGDRLLFFAFDACPRPDPLFPSSPRVLRRLFTAYEDGTLCVFVERTGTRNATRYYIEVYNGEEMREGWAHEPLFLRSRSRAIESILEEKLRNRCTSEGKMFLVSY